MSVKKKSFDLAEKSFNSKIVREWNGYLTIENMFLNTYITEKYKKELHFLPFTSIFIEAGKGSDPEPAIIDWNAPPSDKNTSKNKDDNNEYLFSETKKIKPYKTLYKNTDKRFVFYPVSSINRDNGTWHSMFFLYDRLFNKIDFFDNAGYSMHEHKKYFKKFFRDIHGKKTDVIYNTLVVCYLGKIVADHCHIGYNYKSEGYCVVFTLWILEVRLKNIDRDLSTIEILTKFYYRIASRHPEKLCKLLIGYAQFIHKITDDYELKFTENGCVIRVSKKKMSNTKYRNKTLPVLYSIVSSGGSYKLLA